MDRVVPRKREERINEEIRVPRVRLVDENGGQVGITPTPEALEFAFKKGLDLVEVDERDDTLGKRIREAEVQKVPFVIVYGDREAEAARAWRELGKELAVRERGGEQSTVSFDELLERFRGLAAEADPA